MARGQVIGVCAAESLDIWLADGSAGEGNRDLPAEWSAALELLQEDLRRRDAAERTRRAYAVDLEQFARWARARGRTPAEIDVRDVRRYVARLSEAGAAPAGRRPVSSLPSEACSPVSASTA